MFFKGNDVLLKLFMTSSLITINVIRKPQLLYYPRFFAEEGTNFFSFAYNNSFWQYLSSPQFGYYALYNVVATSLAAKFPLAIAPLVTTYESLFLQVLVSSYVIWSDIAIINSNLKRTLIAIAFPLLCPSQIWLTTIGIQYWLCILCLLVLLDKAPDRNNVTSLFDVMLLILCGLTGPLSCFMAPLFIIKAIEDKSRKFVIYAVTLTACFVVQTLVFIVSGMNHVSELNNRFTSSDGIFIATSKSIVLLFSRLLAYEKTLHIYAVEKMDSFLADCINAISRNTISENYVALYLLSTLVMITVLTWLIATNKRNRDLNCVVLSMFTIYILSVKFSINGIGGPRYMFAPSCMLIMFFIASMHSGTAGTIQRRVTVSLIAIVFMNNGINYVPSMTRVFNDNWPKWSEEVRLWQADEHYPLKIWPPPWQMSLKNKR